MVKLQKYIYIILFVILLNFFFRILQIVFFQDISFISDSLYTSFFKIFIILIILYFIIDKKIFSFKNDIKYSLKISLILLLIIFFISYKYLTLYGINNLFFHFIRCFSVAFFEEIVFRFLIFSCIIFYFKYIKNDASFFYKSIILTTILFSLIHFVNFIFGRYDILSTIIQMEIAFVFGLFLQYIFIKYQSVILVSIIHCLFNYYGSINRVLSTEKFEKIINNDFLDINSFLQNQIILIPLIILSLYLSHSFSKKHADYKSILN